MGDKMKTATGEDMGAYLWRIKWWILLQWLIVFGLFLIITEVKYG